MNNFHLHPAVIRTDVDDYNYFDSVFPSLDAGYTRTLKDKLIYIPKSSDQVAFLSMLGKNEINFLFHNFFHISQSILLKCSAKRGASNTGDCKAI